MGNAHKEPSIPCYHVTRLDHAIVRMVDIELSGACREPAAAEIVRTTGQPTNGACQLEAGTLFRSDAGAALRVAGVRAWESRTRSVASQSTIGRGALAPPARDANLLESRPQPRER